MNDSGMIQEIDCRYLRKRTVARISRGISVDKRPDLHLWICHFPLHGAPHIQCPLMIRRESSCPYQGPFGNN